MKRPLNKKQSIALLQAICDLNARLIGEEPGLVVSAPGKAWIRVNYRRRAGRTNGPKDYPSVERAIAAGWKSLSRAKAIYEGRLAWDTTDIELFDEPLSLPEAVA